MNRKSFVSLALICTVSILMLGASAPKKKQALDAWYRYVGAQNCTAYTNPTNYVYEGTLTPPPASPDIYLKHIHVSTAFEVYSSGIYSGLPKVDVAGSALKNDILDATGCGASSKHDIPNRVLLEPRP